jgi:hypothetical protein
VNLYAVITSVAFRPDKSVLSLLFVPPDAVFVPPVAIFQFYETHFRIGASGVVKKRWPLAFPLSSTFSFLLSVTARFIMESFVFWDDMFRAQNVDFVSVCDHLLHVLHHLHVFFFQFFLLFFFVLFFTVFTVFIVVAIVAFFTVVTVNLFSLVSLLPMLLSRLLSSPP